MFVACKNKGYLNFANHLERLELDNSCYFLLLVLSLPLFYKTRDYLVMESHEPQGPLQVSRLHYYRRPQPSSIMSFIYLFWSQQPMFKVSWLHHARMWCCRVDLFTRLDGDDWNWVRVICKFKQMQSGWALSYFIPPKGPAPLLGRQPS